MGFEDKEEGRGWHRASILARKPVDGAIRGSKLTAMETPSVREYATGAIRYWEPRRVIYNLVLVAVVVAYFVAGYPASKQNLTTDTILVLFLLAVVANVAYCAANLVDMFAQMSGFRELWRSARWILFAVGLTFAAILTRFVSVGMFLSNPAEKTTTAILWCGPFAPLLRDFLLPSC
jgi:hypothetical protein